MANSITYSVSFKGNNESFLTGGNTLTGNNILDLSSSTGVAPNQSMLNIMNGTTFNGSSIQYFGVATDNACSWAASGAAGQVSGNLAINGVFQWTSGSVTNPFSSITVTGLFISNTSATNTANPNFRVM